MKIVLFDFIISQTELSLFFTTKNKSSITINSIEQKIETTR